MNWDKFELNPRIIDAAKKANIRSERDVLGASAPDLQRLTALSRRDVQLLQAAVAASCRQGPPLTALHLHRGEGRGRLSLSCPVLDALLRGGLPLRGLTELSGPSGAGKTQLALQLCLAVQYPEQYGGCNAGAVYICTEESFPIRRLQQLIGLQSRMRPDVPPELLQDLGFSDRVYIEHAADLEALQACLSHKVPLLLARGVVRLLVLDSVAALFRSQFQEQSVERSHFLLALATKLQQLSFNYSLPVLCINQVTDVPDGSDEDLSFLGAPSLLPALGMLWANQVLVRLMLQRCHGSEHRKLRVVFAPHLPRASCVCVVCTEGVRGLPGTQEATD